MRINVHENFVRVIHHLDGSYTMVEVTNDQRGRLTMPNFKIPTDGIPTRLRQIGSRFMLRWQAVWPENGDSIDGIREKLASAYEVIDLEG
jgi:hypothetical protein